MTRLRIGLALAGFAAALLAIVLEDKRVGWAAIALLIGSLVARLWQKRHGQKEIDAPSEENDSV